MMFLGTAEISAATLLSPIHNPTITFSFWAWSKHSFDYIDPDTTNHVNRYFLGYFIPPIVAGGFAGVLAYMHI